MSPLMNYLILLIAIFLSGYGVMLAFRIRLSQRLQLPVSLITGVGVISFLPFLLQLLYMPITARNVFGAVAISAALGLAVIIWRRKDWPPVRLPRLKIYELPFLICMGLLVIISVWRCYYNPVAARDMLTGPEVIAEYAVREHTMINSLFSVDLDVNNNPFKPASVTSLQIIYKFAGFPFGQVWLSIIFISFTVFLYQSLTRHLHPILAGVLILLFTAIPEMYAYTFMLLYDYTNMVFFILSCYFLMVFREQGGVRHILFSGFLLGMAVYFRAETLLFAMLMLPLLLRILYRGQQRLVRIGLLVAAFFVMPVLCYYLPNELYNKHYLPLHYNAAGQLNPHLLALKPLWTRFAEMNTKLIFSNWGQNLYGYFVYVAMLLLVAELLIYRKVSSTALHWLYFAAVIYFGLPLLGHIIPLIDIDNTTKRGLFKMFPCLLFYMANNGLIMRCSQLFTKWEEEPVTLKRTVPAAAARPVTNRKMAVSRTTKRKS